MPAVFRDFAPRSAEGAGFPALEPDTCPLNEYEPGARLSLYQDKNERDAAHPNPTATPCGFKKRAGSVDFLLRSRLPDIGRSQFCQRDGGCLFRPVIAAFGLPFRIGRMEHFHAPWGTHCISPVYNLGLRVPIHSRT